MATKMFSNWEDLEKSIKDCKKCKLCEQRHNIVLGEGNKNADIMLIGEGPGENEDLSGKPFVGKAGEVLDKALTETGMDRKDIYIANIVKCRPPFNRNPKPDEMIACLDYLRNQVILIKPKVIILLGSVALKRILGDGLSITKSRGQAYRLKNIIYVPTFHPAAILHDDTKYKNLVSDIRLAQHFATSNE